MIAIIALLLAAAALIFTAPRLLVAGSWQVHRPRLALAAWHLAFVSGVLALAATVAVAVSIALTATASADGMTAVIQTTLGWAALVAVAAVVVVFGAGSHEVLSSGRHSYGEVLRMPHTADRLEDGITLITCRSDEVFACSLPGSEPAVVVSTGMRELLTPAQLRAVVAHERAHLRGRHHLALRLAEINQACLPRMRSARRLRRSTAMLIELIADDQAARRAGAVHLANALARIASCEGDAGMALRAERLTGRTWRPARRLRPVPAVYRDSAG